MIRGAFAERLLRRHVGRRAKRHAGRRQPRAHDRIGKRFRDPEVGHHRVAPFEQNVFGLDVAVHDPTRVRRRQRVEGLARDQHRIGHRQRPFAQQSCAQRLSRDERHGIPQERIVAPGGEHGHDMRMLQHRDRANLQAESLGAGSDRVLQVEHLYYDLAIERRIAGEKDATHATAAQLPFDAEGRAEGQIQSRPEIIIHGG